MERWFFAAVLGLLTTIGTACSKSPDPGSAEVKRGEHLTDVAHLSSGYDKAPAGSHEKPALVSTDKNDSPTKIVSRFLEAAKSGDQQKLSLLMTKAAREETTKHNINFELESYQNATFDVGDYEYLTPEKNTAHVACKWTDHDGDASFTHDVIWVLRKEEPGWRVVGMITRPFPDQPAVAFNYENVPELLATKASIEQEVKRRAEEEERQARRAGHHEPNSKRD